MGHLGGGCPKLPRDASEGVRASRIIQPFVAVLVMLAAACAGDSTSGIDPVEVRNLTLEVDPPKLYLGQGEVGKIYARLVDDNGANVPTEDISWSSADPGVATVDQSGNVTAVETGTVEVTATSDSRGEKRHRSSRVSVRGRGQLGIHLASGSNQTAHVGETLPNPLVVAVRDGSGNGVSGVEVDWQISQGNGSTSAPTTTTNQNGLTQVVWTVGRGAGSQHVRAQVGGIGTADFAATAMAGAAETVVISPDHATLEVGKQLQFDAAILDEFGNEIDDSRITWASSAGNVAFVDTTGTAIGMSTGSVSVEAYAGPAHGAVSLDVIPAHVPEHPGGGDPGHPGGADPVVASIAASVQGHTFTGLNQSYQLTATARDASGAVISGIDFDWSSSATSVATVDDMGLVVARAVGTASIVVSAVCCSAADTVTVQVTDVVEGPPGATTISVTPPTFTIEVGQTVDLTARVEDSHGNPIAGNDSWATDDSGVATSDGQGLVAGVGVGTVTLSVQAGSANTTVFGLVEAGDVGKVSDLAHVGDGILSWTQVGNGVGGPANYAIRYRCPTLEWGDAYDTEVTVEGTAIGTSIEYDTGQQPGSCEWRLVSYRGTLNQNAVFGPISNSTTVELAGPTGTVPAEIQVNPSSFSLTVGATRELSATVFDAEGQAMSGVPISWVSTAPLVAIILSTGPQTALVTGLVPGTATFEATLASSPSAVPSASVVLSGPSAAASQGMVGQATGTVEGSGGGGGGGGGGGSTTWPQEPNTLTLISDRPASALNENGWLDYWTDKVSVQTDPTSPASPGGVLQYRYSKGEGGPGVTVQGGGSALMVPNGGVREIYVGFWVKLSADWQEHSTQASPKLVFLVDNNSGGGGDPFVLVRNPDGQVQGVVQNAGAPPYREFPRIANAAIRPGEWARVEILAAMNSRPNSADGQMRVWVNGVKVIDVTDVWFSDAAVPNWDVVDFKPLWGGQGDVLTRDNYLWVDHIHVSGR